MKAVLTQEQLRAVFDRVLAGEKISRLAAELGVNRSALNDRLKRRFPDEYEDAVARGKIKAGGAPATFAARALKLLDDPAVKDYLNNGGTLKEVSATHNLPLPTLHYRVQKALKAQAESVPPNVNGTADRQC